MERNKPISITAIASISALGISSASIWENHRNNEHFLIQKQFVDSAACIAPLPEVAQQEIENLRNSNSKYQYLDPSVLYGIFASKRAMSNAGWETGDNFGINIGSSRGATTLFEKYHEQFINQKHTHLLASPTTTLGNISSWIAHDLQTNGPEISHSITCSTALHSVLNGIAWIRSGMANKFLVGGSEAPLTQFTIAQMKALKIYTDGKGDYPCRALDLEKKLNTMVLGEGAAMACLEKGIPKNSLAVIEGIGYATEPLEHYISISADAKCFQKSMHMALGNVDPNTIDAIVMHAPGTLKGDKAEYTAIKKVFPDKLPALTTNKWKVGHTFGASGMLSLELAILMMQHQEFVKVPFVYYDSTPTTIKKVMVNAVGFGGNAVSIVLGLP